DISDPQEVIARAKALSLELATPITPGFGALVFKASRGIEDIYELTYIRKDGSRFPAVVSVTALRDANNAIIGYLLIGTDNTARKQADDNLRRASEYARSLIEASLDPLVTISPEGKITDVNAGSAKVTGVPREKLIGTDFSNYFTEPEKAREGYQQVFAKGFVTDYPLTIRHEDGRLTDVLYNASVYKDAQGNVLGVFAAARDITARMQAEAALVKAGALQSAIFNSANFSSIATDARGVIQIFNVGAERMLGYSAAEVMNKITPADISDPQEVIARAAALSIELGTPITPGFEALVFKASRGIEDIYELTYIRKDGSRFPAVVSVTALRDDQGAIIGYLLIGTDNTARKQVEAEQKKLDQRLRDQQFYTRSLIESNIDALMTTDQSGIISDVNKQMEALTGCTRDELIGAPFKSFFTDAERAEAGIKRVLNENKVTNYELTARARDGKETVVSYNATTFYDRDHNLQGVFAAARDVTERRMLDRALQETNVALEGAKFAAEKANLAKSDFLSSMSHELRSPLNAILGFAQLMESGVPLPTPSQKDSIDQILQAGWYLLELINEILDLSLIESGKLSLSLDCMSLIEVLNGCQSMIEPQAQTAGISIRFPDFTDPYFVNADPTRVKQVLVNLLSNAIKYNRVGGTVEVTCGVVADERTRISFRDTGEGLSPEKIAQLFQPFNRLGQESGAEQGTGIGLVVCKRLVELMGGEIGVESTVGVGSVFWIELNTTVAESGASGNIEMAPVPPAPTQAGEALRTVLCVEDNPANLMLIERLIARRSDIRLLSAKNGSHGIEIARTAQPDAILMDINLPGISGIRALQILSQDPATAHIPVIAVSANAMAHDIEKGLEAGFFRYLTKPIKVNEFMDTLDLALAVSRPAAAEADAKQQA
ncbi:MAG: PAS domain S-box protein, partial [Bacteriovorax sp.]|nr:PAS domain S-box protein [Rhizobacter sp.]